MGIEVVVGRQDSGADEFLLKDADKFKQVFRMVVAYVVDLVWRDWQTVFSCLFLRCVLHHADNAFDDVVHVGEITLAVAVVEDFYFLAFE